MQQIAIWLIICMMGTLKLAACDICGSASSGQFLGILKDAPENMLSIHYTQTVFETRHPPNLFGDEFFPVTEETFRFINLGGKYRINERINAQASVPIGFINQTGYNTRQRGLGDVQLRVNYLLTDQLLGESMSTLITVVGAGLSIPTGEFHAAQDFETINPNLQLGTGAFGFFLSTQSTLRIGNSGLNAELSYRINNENEDGYRFGNQVNSAIRYFYLFSGEKLNHAPLVGLAFKYADRSTSFGNPINITGGYKLLFELGYEFWVQNVNFGLSFMLPANQELSEGLVSNQYQFSTKFLYFL
ncbi:MAG: hypothetical protein EA362_11700 [Saprospirales bacterium]|nr:MAG: hypothetical protein EA362_11700 [Saprospirales bacterium]